jgi:hypothetical protein
VVCFQHRDDAERFWAALRERFAKFGLGLNDDKTRLIEFGRFAAQSREARGLGKPETFEFLGFTHISAKSQAGWFKLQRITSKKRMRAKLRTVKTELMRRRHLPIAEQGQWLRSVVLGHDAYYAVPDNSKAITAFRNGVTRHWRRALRVTRRPRACRLLGLATTQDAPADQPHRPTALPPAGRRLRDLQDHAPRRLRPPTNSTRTGALAGHHSQTIDVVREQPTRTPLNPVSSTSTATPPPATRTCLRRTLGNGHVRF